MCFTKQNKFIQSQFEEQTKTIISELNSQTEEIIYRSQKFLVEEKIRELLVASEGLHKTLDEHLLFLDPYRYRKINDNTATTLTHLVDITKDTDMFTRIKRNFENVCLDSKASFMQLNYTIIENRFCTSVLYNFLAINMKRETVLNTLISKLRQSNHQRESVEGYLNIAAVRKKEMKTWIRNKIMKNDSLVCPLFIADIGNWKYSIYMQHTKNFIMDIDSTMVDRLKGLTSEYCQAVVNNRVKEFCQCNEEGVISIYCDIDGKKCHCNDKFRGEKCLIRNSKFDTLYKDVSSLTHSPSHL